MVDMIRYPTVSYLPFVQIITFVFEFIYFFEILKRDASLFFEGHSQNIKALKTSKLKKKCTNCRQRTCCQAWQLAYSLNSFQ